MHTDALRKHALGALKIWGTKENVPIIAKIMQQEAFVKIDCMDMLEKFQDERAIEPLITTLNEAFREGERAEEILADWWPQAEQPLVKHLHDKEGRLRERTQRILELRKTDQALLITQTLEDIKSSNRDIRKSHRVARQNLKSNLTCSRKSPPPLSPCFRIRATTSAAASPRCSASTRPRIRPTSSSSSSTTRSTTSGKPASPACCGWET